MDRGPCILHADGIFIVLLAAIGAALAYVTFRYADSSGEIDVIPTEVEKCLTGYSYVYWVLRGDLQLFSHVPTDPTLLALARDYFCYPLAVPFCVIFAKMMRPRYAASFWLNAIASLLAYALVIYTSTYAKERVEGAIAASASCHELGAQHAFSTYNQSFVTFRMELPVHAAPAASATCRRTCAPSCAMSAPPPATP